MISIVLPVHGVAGYLRECLDSVLEPRADVEVIAVNDCSPDASGAILAEYAARDRRLKVITLERNVGQGPARDLGLAEATGEYVWFLDSDDWLAPGALRAITRRLRADAPDVLIVDYVRMHWDGTVEPSSSVHLLPRAPATFALRDWPDALKILHVVWNKVIRRDLLDKVGFTFASGWYEDVPFTYEHLVAAERIAVLNRVCVNYRQRRQGAATRTLGDGHFAIFANWERVWATLDFSRPEVAALRPHLFARMVWHFLIVLGNRDRLSGKHRRAFFARASENYQRYLPAEGYPMPGGVEGRKHRLVARGRYLLFEAGLNAVPVARAAKRLLRATAKRGRDVAFRAYYRVNLWLPMDRSLALYAAYWYRGYACNPAAIYAKARELAPQVRGVWVVTRGNARSMPPGVPYVVAGSLRYHRLLARAHWLINNVNWPNWIAKRPGSVHVMTHHGTPLKVMGVEQARYPAGVTDADFAGQLRRVDRWDYSITANPFTTEVWERSYPSDHTTLEIGYPRNDRLATATPAEVAEVRARLGLQPGQRAILYAPTHREWQPRHHQVLDVEELAARLGPDDVLLVRAHYFHGSYGSAGARDVSSYPVVEDLYLAADVLITDYSSLMFDYAVLDRPIVIYAPDWAAYRSVRGVTFDLFAQPPGAVTTTLAELVTTLAAGEYADEARAAFRERFCALEDGHAAERAVRHIFGV